MGVMGERMEKYVVYFPRRMENIFEYECVKTGRNETHDEHKEDD